MRVRSLGISVRVIVYIECGRELANPSYRRSVIDITLHELESKEHLSFSDSNYTTGALR